MRTFMKLMAGAATAASVTAMILAGAPAMADPPAHTTVHNFDVVGVGSDTIQSVLDQLSLDFNTAQVAAHHSDAANTRAFTAGTPRTRRPPRSLSRSSPSLAARPSRGRTALAAASPL